MTILIVLALAFAGHQSWYPAVSQASARAKTNPQVPADFAYPESASKTELKSPIKAKSLAGIVADPGGFPIPDVLVERVSSDWKTRVDATLTNSEGSFALAKALMRQSFLKLSKPGFDTLLVRVITTKTSKAQATLTG